MNTVTQGIVSAVHRAPPMPKAAVSLPVMGAPGYKTVTMEDIKKAQSEDLDTKAHYLYKKHGLLPGHSMLKDTVLAESNAMDIANGLLVDKHSRKIIVPARLRRDIIEQAHDHAGHRAIDEVTDLLSRDYTWPKMKETISNHVRSCTPCNNTKPKPMLPQPLGAMHPAERFNFRVAVDALTGLPRTPTGATSAVIMVDAFTGFVEAAALQSTSSQEVAAAILENWIYRFTAPSEIVSDNGPEMAGVAMQHLVKQFNIRHIFTSAKHSRSNQAERQIRTLNEFLRVYAPSESAQPWLWQQLLKPFCMTLNATRNTRGFSAYFLAHGTMPRLPFQNLTSFSTNYKQSALSERFTNLAKACQLAAHKQAKIFAENKARFDKSAKAMELQEDT